jgi:hypothetical protein
MVCSDVDHGRSSRSSVEDQEGSSTDQVLGGRTIERSGDAMCDLQRAQEVEERGFFG